MPDATFHAQGKQTSYAVVVGRVLAFRRRMVALDQTRIAERANLSQSSWSKVERGETAVTVEQLMLAASALEAYPAEILRWADGFADWLGKEHKVEVKKIRAASGADNQLTRKMLDRLAGLYFTPD